VTPDELLAAYDDLLREEAEMRAALSWDRHGPVLRGVFSHGGFVSYRDLGGLSGPHLDQLIAETVAHYRDDTGVASFEWKTRGHDLPADLGDRLMSHGLVPDEVETVMLGEASLLAGEVQVPAEVVLRRAGEGAGLRDDVVRILALQESVFGRGGGPSVDAALAERDGGDTEYWLAEVDGRVVCAGRLTVVPGTGIAGIWGGGTDPAWRGRGIYRALVAARARSALAGGVRLLHSDCSAMSRPILERSGLVPVTTTTPYVWTR
jgi:ribosomal protein S18 acetylase RimI-like enzyme